VAARIDNQHPLRSTDRIEIVAMQLLPIEETWVETVPHHRLDGVVTIVPQTFKNFRDVSRTLGNPTIR
jgi:hypothetical protein